MMSKNLYCLANNGLTHTYFIVLVVLETETCDLNILKYLEGWNWAAY